nr:hypothetical protein [Candidatus Sigynarchaeota archaeon]
MASNMNKFLAILAGILAIIAVIPIDFLSWWKADVDPSIGANFSNYITAFAQFYKWNGSSYDIIPLDNMYLITGILVIVGAVLLFAGGAKAIKALAFLGALITIAGPIVFLIAHNGNDVLSAWYNLYTRNLFFGTDTIALWDLGGSTTWYLNVGFFLPLGAGLLGFLSLKSNK